MLYNVQLAVTISVKNLFDKYSDKRECQTSLGIAPSHVWKNIIIVKCIDMYRYSCWINACRIWISIVSYEYIFWNFCNAYTDSMLRFAKDIGWWDICWKMEIMNGVIIVMYGSIQWLYQVLYMLCYWDMRTFIFNESIRYFCIDCFLAWNIGTLATVINVNCSWFVSYQSCAFQYA